MNDLVFASLVVTCPLLIGVCIDRVIKYHRRQRAQVANHNINIQNLHVSIAINQQNLTQEGEQNSFSLYRDFEKTRNTTNLNISDLQEEPINSGINLSESIDSYSSSELNKEIPIRQIQRRHSI